MASRPRPRPIWGGKRGAGGDEAEGLPGIMGGTVRHVPFVVKQPGVSPTPARFVQRRAERNQGAAIAQSPEPQKMERATWFARRRSAVAPLDPVVDRVWLRGRRRSSPPSRPARLLAGG